MPTLINIRHENFCRIMLTAAAKGITQARAYQLAGYDVDDHTARMAASRLMTKDNIRARLAELQVPQERRVKTDAASLLEKAETVFVRAVEKDQLSAARGSIELQAKLSGALVDRVEIGGAGEFDRLTTPAEVVDALLLDGEPRTLLDALRLMLELVEERVALASSAAAIQTPGKGGQVPMASRPRRR
jgi:hypothetical protein